MWYRNEIKWDDIILFYEINYVMVDTVVILCGDRY